MSDALWILVPVSFVTSTISAVLGMAGGITLIGVMTMVMPAASVVPVHGVVQLSSNCVRSAVFFRHVRWRYLAIYVAPLVVGTVLATQLWSGEKLTWFKPLIGAFILVFLFWRRFAPALRNPPLPTYGALGLVVGFIQIFVGATGPFLAPFFLREDFDKEEVIATKAICQTAGHLLKIPAFFMLGFDYRAEAPLLLGMIAAGFFGTLTGKHLLGRMSTTTFVVLFEGVLSLIAFYLIGATLLEGRL